MKYVRDPLGRFWPCRDEDIFIDYKKQLSAIDEVYDEIWDRKFAHRDKEYITDEENYLQCH